MKATLALGIAMIAATSGEAWASPRLVGVRIDNDAATQVEVYVDGAWRGSVFRGDERTFTTTPGRRDVRVVSTAGVPLYQDSLVVTPHRMVEIDVCDPTATLRLDNDGQAPLYVTLPGAPGMWVNPGDVRTVQVRAGSVPITTALSTPRGLQQLGTETLRVAGGRTYTHEIAWFAPRASSHITVTNGERNFLRVYVGGQEVGVIPAHGTRTIAVPTGRQLVTVIESNGNLVYNEPVHFDPRKDHEILFDERGNCTRGRGGTTVAGHVSTTTAHHGYASTTSVSYGRPMHGRR
jgi:hypothetical protein